MDNELSDRKIRIPGHTKQHTPNEHHGFTDKERLRTQSTHANSSKTTHSSQ
jgi:hypothetical protein